jgi:hypothetical protein
MNFQKQEKSDVQLNVNDPDLYQDGNRMREEEEQERDEKRGLEDSPLLINLVYSRISK